MTLLVTGATGFLGQHLLARLQRDGTPFRAALRSASLLPPGVDVSVVGEMDGDADWRAALVGVTTVIHMAGLAHGAGKGSATALRRVNVEGTAGLARAAAAAGVRRMVLLSTAKVHGQASRAGHPFRENDRPAPPESYSRSKLEAELQLRSIATSARMEFTIVRSVLVYGPGVKANFHALLRAVARGIPLPLGAVDNRRSLIFVENLIDALLVCAQHPSAAGEAFLVSDGESLSTPELLRRAGAALGRSPRLISVPPSLLQWGARVAGRAVAAERLLGSFEVNQAHIEARLGWRPPASTNDGLRATADWYRRTHAAGT